jgi:hypothetical protein
MKTKIVMTILIITAAILLTAMPGYATTYEDSLKAYWKFDEPAGASVAVDSINGLNGNNTGVATGAQGKHGNAYSFDFGNYVNIPNGYTNTIKGDNTHTVSYWVQQTAYNTYGDVHIDMPGAGLGWAIQWLSSNQIYLCVGGGGRFHNLSTPLNLGEWYNFTLVKTGSTTGDFYINGVLQPGSGGLGSTYDVNSDWLIGRYHGGSTWDFKGALDDIAVWNRALDAWEIEQSMNYGVNAFEYLKTQLSYGDTQMDSLWGAYTSHDSVSINGLTWNYYSGLMPGDDGSKAIGDAWTYNGGYYIKLGSGMGTGVPEPATVVSVIGLALMGLGRMRKRTKSLLSILLLMTAMLLIAMPGHADSYRQEGAQFRVNTYTTDVQGSPSAAMDGSGNFMIAWESNGQDGDWWGIYSQRYSSSGVAEYAQDQLVNTNIVGQERYPVVAMNDAGNAVVTWQNPQTHWGVAYQRYNADGSKNAEGELRPYTGAPYWASQPSSAIDTAGNFAVSWYSVNGDGTYQYIFTQRLNSDGTKNGAAIPSQLIQNHANMSSPSVAMVQNGDPGVDLKYVVAWTAGPQTNECEIWKATYNADGTPIVGTVKASPNDASVDALPAVAVADNGNYVIVWQTNESQVSYDIYGKIYDKDGNVIKSKFLITSSTLYDQQSPSVAMDSSGNFIVVWSDSHIDGSGYGIAARKFDANGNALTAATRVNSDTTGSQWAPSVALSSNGDFVISWYGVGTSDADGVYATRYISEAPFESRTLSGSNVTESAKLDMTVYGPDDKGNPAPSNGMNTFAFRIYDTVATTYFKDFYLNLPGFTIDAVNQAGFVDYYLEGVEGIDPTSWDWDADNERLHFNFGNNDLITGKFSALMWYRYAGDGTSNSISEGYTFTLVDDPILFTGPGPKDMGGEDEGGGGGAVPEPATVASALSLVALGLRRARRIRL